MPTAEDAAALNPRLQGDVESTPEPFQKGSPVAIVRRTGERTFVSTTFVTKVTRRRLTVMQGDDAWAFDRAGRAVSPARDDVRLEPVTPELVRLADARFHLHALAHRLITTDRHEGITARRMVAIELILTGQADRVRRTLKGRFPKADEARGLRAQALARLRGFVREQDGRDLNLPREHWYAVTSLLDGWDDAALGHLAAP